MYKNVPEYSNYKVSEGGEVINTNTGKTLATQLNSRGYPTVNLWKNNKLKKFTLHRLVATLFIENIDNLPCVNHIDKNKLNSNVTNLEWCSYQYNSQHSLEDTVKARATSGATVPIRYFKNSIWVYYNSIMDAHRDTKISITTIRNSLKKVYKNSLYTFEYVN